MTYEGKIHCERCKKPIGEKIRVGTELIHQPYISYRKYGSFELCNICKTELEQQEHRQAWRREQGII